MNMNTLCTANMELARAKWGELPRLAICALEVLTKKHGLSIAAGDLLLLEGSWYVTHAGLLGIAERRHCSAITTAIENHLSDPIAARWVFKAVVYKRSNSRGFVGFGDADPSNVSSIVHGAEMRVAETRAVNRALRRAFGIGLCSIEELGWKPAPLEPERHQTGGPIGSANGNGRHHSGTEPRLRDRLSLLIRQHRLDAGLVKAYASDYCGAPVLRDATRESIEAFINHLTEKVVHDREGLLCQLNSYAKAEEANS